MPKDLFAEPLRLKGDAGPAHIQIEHWLSQVISRGDLRVGDKLPPEKDLAARLGVSRMTLRQALGQLESRGIIIRTPGRAGGTFVAEPTVDIDLSQWSGFTDHVRQANLRAGARVVRARTMPADRAVSTALELAKGAPVHEIVRMRTVQRLPAALEQSFYPASLFPDLLDHKLTGSCYALLRCHYGHDPRKAVERIEPVLSTAEQATLLRVASESALTLITRTAFTGAGLPVEFARDLFRPDRIRIVVHSDLRDGVQRGRPSIEAFDPATPTALG